MIILIAMLVLPGAKAEPRPGFVRLHVIADDNSSAAQSLKLKVRDACLDYARKILKDCENDEAAWKAVNGHLEAIESIAAATAGENGFSGPVRAETGVFAFPDRTYGEVTVPAGEYRALRIVIGEGTGRNWWCVLYPSLCMPEEYEPGMEVRFYSSIARWFERIFGGDAA